MVSLVPFVAAVSCVCAGGGFGGESRGGGFRGYRQRSLPDGGDELITPQEGEGPVQRRRGGGGGFRGRARGAAGAPGGPPMQRREFDRHSGTGRGREVKKHGAGNHNWGQEEAENHPVKTDALLEEDAAAKEVEPEVAGETPEEVREESMLRQRKRSAVAACEGGGMVWSSKGVFWGVFTENW